MSDGALSVGDAAARLGIAPETLRSYGHRYGLVPSTRTPGGHRRYSDEDMARLARMLRLVTEGISPAEAAARVRPDATRPRGTKAKSTSPTARRRPGGPGGRVLATPGASAEARGIARAASRLDTEAVAAALTRLLAERGAVATWEEALVPVFLAIGRRWARSGEGVDVEHLLSETVMDTYRRHRAEQPAPRSGAPVVLAAYPEEQHVLPLHVLAAALAEQRVPVRMLGARVPLLALENASRRVRASALFVWRQLPARPGEPVELPSRPKVRVLVGGPGWAGVVLEPGVQVVGSVREAIDVLVAGVLSHRES